MLVKLSTEPAKFDLSSVACLRNESIAGILAMAPSTRLSATALIGPEQNKILVLLVRRERIAQGARTLAMLFAGHRSHDAARAFENVDCRIVVPRANSRDRMMCPSRIDRTSSATGSFISSPATRTV